MDFLVNMPEQFFIHSSINAPTAETARETNCHSNTNKDTPTHTHKNTQSWNTTHCQRCGQQWGQCQGWALTLWSYSNQMCRTDPGSMRRSPCQSCTQRFLELWTKSTSFQNFLIWRIPFVSAIKNCQCSRQCAHMNVLSVTAVSE